MMETEIVVIYLQARECQDLLEPAEAKRKA